MSLAVYFTPDTKNNRYKIWSETQILPGVCDKYIFTSER